MNSVLESRLLLTRRHFFGLSSVGIGVAALASLINPDLFGAAGQTEDAGARTATGGLTGLPHFKPRAKRVIYLFQSGAPSQMDLFDYKPKLSGLRATDLPESIRKGQRLTTMTAGQSSFP